MAKSPHPPPPPPPPPPPFTTEAFVILIIDKSSLGIVASYEDVLSLATF